jgi:hypothetical protein
MAKQRTKRKSNKQPMPAEVSAVINLATDYIANWTKTELYKIEADSNTPICVSIPGGFKIGQYFIQVESTKRCIVLNSFKEHIHTFQDKRSAVLYTLHLVKRQYKAADQIVVLDDEINKNYTDVQIWRTRIAKARQRKDYEVVDIRNARLRVAEKHLEIARDNLSKIYLSAKYNKIWDL